MENRTEYRRTGRRKKELDAVQKIRTEYRRKEWISGEQDGEEENRTK